MFEKDCVRRNISDLKKYAHKAACNKDREFGIKKYSALLKYGFDVIEKTPLDIMHVLLEGVARRMLMKIIYIWVSSKRTTLSELNYRLKSFNYGYSHIKNRISFLGENDLKKKNLIISASQMHTLVLLFPLIFFDILDTSTDDYV